MGQWGSVGAIFEQLWGAKGIPSAPILQGDFPTNTTPTQHAASSQTRANEGDSNTTSTQHQARPGPPRATTTCRHLPSIFRSRPPQSFLPCPCPCIQSCRHQTQALLCTKQKQKQTEDKQAQQRTAHVRSRRFFSTYPEGYPQLQTQG